MLVSLGSAMALGLRERNELLVAAGFAPIYRTSSLDAPEMSHIEKAVTAHLRLQEPNPALLLDRAWNVLRLNDGAARLFAWLGVCHAPGQPVNALRLLFDEDLGLRRSVVNFEELADAALARLQGDPTSDDELAALLRELERLRGPTTRGPTSTFAGHAVALPVRLRHAGVDLGYLTTLTTFGMPLDVTAQDLAIEAYFPLDDATSEHGRRLATEAP